MPITILILICGPILSSDELYLFTTCSKRKADYAIIWNEYISSWTKQGRKSWSAPAGNKACIASFAFSINFFCILSIDAKPCRAEYQAPNVQRARAHLAGPLRKPIGPVTSRSITRSVIRQETRIRAHVHVLCRPSPFVLSFIHSFRKWESSYIYIALHQPKPVVWNYRMPCTLDLEFLKWDSPWAIYICTIYQSRCLMMFSVNKTYRRALNTQIWQ